MAMAPPATLRKEITEQGPLPSLPSSAPQMGLTHRVCLKGTRRWESPTWLCRNSFTFQKSS